MNIDALKKTYSEFLHTDKGKSLMLKSISLKKEWNEEKGNVCSETRYVNMKYIDKTLHKDITKLTINPIGLYLMCHQNVKVFESDKIKKTLGFNITACPCGKQLSYELHSVNKIDDKLYDFTKDFNDEKEKYFLEIGDIKPEHFTYLWGNNYYNINLGCKCRIDWGKNEGVLKVKEKDIINIITNTRRINFIEME